MKKLTAVILAFVLTVVTFTACSGGAPTDTSVSTDAPDSVTDISENTESAANNENGTSGETAKTLVVYYSATGSTKKAAETVAAALGADIFEIIPTEPYTSDDLNWNDKNSRVSVEHDNEDKREIPLEKITPDNFDSYDTVYIGYPIWWGIAAWPVNGFVKGNDFSGKTVIPFCTSASSGIGKSGELLAEAAGTGNWLEGERFSSGASEEDIQNWLNKIETR